MLNIPNQKFCNHFSKLWRNVNLKIVSKNIGEHSILYFSTNIFWGNEIVQGGGEILPKVSSKV